MQLIPPDRLRTDGGTQSRAAIDPEVVAEYAAAIAAGAVLPQIVAFFDGTDYWLADGFHRVAAHVAAGCPNVSTDVRQGDRRAAILYSVGANAAHGLRRTNADKRRAVEALLRDEEWRGWSDREIGKRCGVDGKLVASVRSELSADEPQMAERLVSRGGTTYSMNTAAIARKPSDDAPGLSLDAEEAIAGDRADDGTPIVRRNDPALVGSVMPRRPAGPVLVEAPVGVPAEATTVPRDGDEWYTPAKFIEAARAVMGAIDLDPASCAAANATVGAEAFYDEAADGLTQPWYGRVWLNPPYSDTGTWIAKLLEHVETGMVTEAFVLVNAKVESGWFDSLWAIAPVICFVRGRISFVAGDGGKSQTGYYGQAIAYAGPNRAAFIETFGQFGRLAVVLGAAEVPA